MSRKQQQEFKARKEQETRFSEGPDLFHVLGITPSSYKEQMPDVHDTRMVRELAYDYILQLNVGLMLTQDSRDDNNEYVEAVRFFADKANFYNYRDFWLDKTKPLSTSTKPPERKTGPEKVKPRKRLEMYIAECRANGEQPIIKQCVNGNGLAGISLQDVDLRGCDFRDVHMTKQVLKGARLGGYPNGGGRIIPTNLEGVNMHSANIAHAIFDEHVLMNEQTDLSNIKNIQHAKGFDQIPHVIRLNDKAHKLTRLQKKSPPISEQAGRPIRYRKDKKNWQARVAKDGRSVAHAGTAEQTLLELAATYRDSAGDSATAELLEKLAAAQRAKRQPAADSQFISAVDLQGRENGDGIDWTALLGEDTAARANGTEKHITDELDEEIAADRKRKKGKDPEKIKDGVKSVVQMFIGSNMTYDEAKAVLKRVDGIIFEQNRPKSSKPHSRVKDHAAARGHGTPRSSGRIVS